VENELKTDFDGAAISVLARTVDVVGVAGEGFEIDVAVEVEVGSRSSQVSDTRSGCGKRLRSRARCIETARV
jgi:hypothetical protein